MAKQQIVLMDKDGKVLKTLEDKASGTQLTEVAELAKTNTGAVLTTLADKAKTDPYKPVGIKVVQFINDTNPAKVVEDNAASFKGLILSFSKPSDNDTTTEYEFSHINKEFEKNRAFEKPVRIDTDALRKQYALSEKDTTLLYYFVEVGSLAISPATFKEKYLAQVRRKIEGTSFSDWGTQLHNEYAISGMGTIFGTDVDVAYSTRDASVGLVDGKSFKISYAKIREQKIGENLPERIFADKPESSLLGVAVEVSKLKYHMRNKTFNLAVGLKTNDISDNVAFYNASYKPSVPITAEADIPAEAKTTIADLKTKGIQLFDGIYIKEINFALDITDENPLEITA